MNLMKAVELTPTTNRCTYPHALIGIYRPTYGMKASRKAYMNIFDQPAHEMLLLAAGYRNFCDGSGIGQTPPAIKFTDQRFCGSHCDLSTWPALASPRLQEIDR